MVSSAQPIYQPYSHQSSSSVSPHSKQQAKASMPQDTVSLSETLQDAKAG